MPPHDIVVENKKVGVPSIMDRTRHCGKRGIRDAGRERT